MYLRFFSYNILKTICLAVYIKFFLQNSYLCFTVAEKMCERGMALGWKGHSLWEKWDAFSVAVEKTVAPVKVVIGNSIKRYITGKQKRFFFHYLNGENTYFKVLDFWNPFSFIFLNVCCVYSAYIIDNRA